MQKQIILILFISVWSFQIFAQNRAYNFNTDKNLTQYIIDDWTTLNGLPTNSLVDICQTQDGYIWISSYEGLLRFNGAEFTVFNTENTKAFKTNGIGALEESADGTLWITTQSSGLVSYKNGTFTSHNYDDIQQLYSVIHIDKKNRIWLASPQKGWFMFENGKYTPLNYSQDLKNIELTAIAEQKDGTLWFASLQNGLMKYQNNKFTVYKKDNGLLSDWVNYVFIDENDLLWVATDVGLSTFDEEKFTVIPEFAHNSISTIVTDDFHNFWISSLHGLYLKRNNSNKYLHIDNKSGLSHNYITRMLLDKENNLWIINYRGGLTRIKDAKFTSYTEKQKLSGKLVNAVCEIDSAVILVGLNNGKINMIKNNEVSEFKTKASLEGKRIRHILKDSKGNIWISTYSGLLKIYPDKTEKWYSDKNKFPSRFIRLTFEDSKHNIWVGTRDNGIVKINKDETYTVINKKNGLNVNLILALDEDKNGNIWAGTAKGGLSLIKNDSLIKTYTQKDGLLSNVVFNITPEDDKIWIAVNGGLNCIINDKIYSFPAKKDILPTSPYDILKDDKGDYWFPCSEGIINIKKDELTNALQKDSINKLNYKLYNKYDGLINAECNATSISIKASDGTLWFPMLNGIASLDLENIPTNTYIPPVHIEALIIDDKAVNLYEDIKLEQGKKRYIFNYAALCYYEPQNVFYKHKLEGYEEQWSEASKSRTISYTNLPHGKYTFKVIACNNDGLWNEKGTELSFTIKPLFYQTNWFYATVAVGFMLIFYGIYHLRVLHLKRKQKRLEKIIKLRTSEIIEKNEELLQQKDEIQAQANELEKLSVVASETNNAILIFDKNLNLEWVNRGYTKIYGENLKDLLSDGNYNLLEKSKHKDIEQLVETAVSEKKSVVYETENQGKNAKIWVQTNLTPIFEGDELKKIIAVETDINEIQNAKTKISYQNKQIKSSISYAQTIQQASLPAISDMQKHFDCFLIYKPKDIVSGDFYWMSELSESNEIIIAEVDCTGHGVPGAFMSLIGNTLLNEIVNYKKITEPAAILTELDLLVKKALRQEQTDNPDGMDMSLCKYKKLENGDVKITFAGAKQDLFYYKQTEQKVSRLKGDRKSIGGILKKISNNRAFTNKEIILNKNDMLYMMSDGLADQNNAKRRKLGTAKLTEILNEIVELDTQTQKQIIEDVLKQWQGAESQRDDITFIGIKIR